MFVKEQGQPLKWRDKEPKKFASYNGGEQPGGKGNEAAESQKSGSAEGELMKAHGKPHKVTVESDHKGGTHKVTADFEDGYNQEDYHTDGKDARDAAERYEQGGPDDWTDRKRRISPDQQGAESSERNYLNSTPA